MEANESLPPSPPATHSSKGSPTMPTETSPTFTPPKSPEEERTKHSASPPAIGSSPLPPLSAEVFLSILKHIEPIHRPRLRLVSRSWAAFLISEPQLWPRLFVDLHGDSSTERWIQLWSSRASINSNSKTSGGIRELILRLDSADRGPGHYYGDTMLHDVVVQRMCRLFQCAAEASVTNERVDINGTRRRVKPSTLNKLKVSSYPNTITSIFVLDALMRACREPLFENVQDVDIYANTPQLRLTRNVLKMWPTVANLKLRFPTRSAKATRLVPVGNGWRFGPPAVRGGHRIGDSLNNIRTIEIQSAYISRNIDLPLMPQLTHLCLRYVVWEGKSLFRLLRYVRKTIVSIELDDFEFEEELSNEMEQDEWDTHVNIRDQELVDDHPFTDDDSISSDERMEDPAPIIFPCLRRLILEGNSTPPIFSSLEYVDNPSGDPSCFPTPIFVMPNLVVASLSDVVTEQDFVLDESFGALATLGRNAPNVRDLSISTAVATDDSIFHCLAAMSAQMRRLCFYDSEVTDQLICKLVDLVPQLEELDVRVCTSVSTQSVARFVEMLRDTHGTRIKIIRIDPPDGYSTSWDRIAYTWLDFIGVLVRDPSDFEGDGPEEIESEERRRWKVGGKLSWERTVRQKWEESKEAERLAAVAQLAALGSQQQAGGSGGSGSSSSMGSVTPAGGWIQAIRQQQSHQQPHYGHFAPSQHPPSSISIPSQVAPVQQQQSHPTIDPRLAALDSIRTTPVARMDTN